MTKLIGHNAARAAFATAWVSGRMHHAWLICGPEGIGKATLAQQFASQALALDALPEAHPNVLILRREVNEKGKLAQVISVDQIRSLTPFFGMTAGGEGWRVVIIDAADDMNKNAANALLKLLEEPPTNCLFLLISHSVSRLLPTIRSRCRMLRCAPLGEAEMRQALWDLPAQVQDRLIPLSGGSPGRARRFAEEGVLAALEVLERLLSGHPVPGPDRIALAEGLAAAKADRTLETVFELYQLRLAAFAKVGEGPALARRVALWEKARDLAGASRGLSLDARLVVAELLESAQAAA
jgi:DNA polymerase III subunit delta'